MDQQPEPSARGSFLSIFLALLCGGGFLVFLIIVSGMFFFYVTLAVFGIALVGFLHYILWGQALTAETAAERAVEEEKARAEAGLYSRDTGIRRM